MPRPTSDRSPSRPLSKGGRPVLRKEWPRHEIRVKNCQPRKAAHPAKWTRPHSHAAQRKVANKTTVSSALRRKATSLLQQRGGTRISMASEGHSAANLGKAFSASGAQAPVVSTLAERWLAGLHKQLRYPNAAFCVQSTQQPQTRSLEHQGHPTAEVPWWQSLMQLGGWGSNKPDFSRSGRRQARSAQR